MCTSTLVLVMKHSVTKRGQAFFSDIPLALINRICWFRCYCCCCRAITMPPRAYQQTLRSRLLTFWGDIQSILQNQVNLGSGWQKDCHPPNISTFPASLCTLRIQKYICDVFRIGKRDWNSFEASSVDRTGDEGRRGHVTIEERN